MFANESGVARSLLRSLTRERPRGRGGVIHPSSIIFWACLVLDCHDGWVAKYDLISAAQRGMRDAADNRPTRGNGYLLSACRSSPRRVGADVPDQSHIQLHKEV